MSLALLISLSLLSFAYSDCVIMKTDLNGPPTNATGPLAIPQMYGNDWTGGVACPEFQNVPNCCNANLNTVQLSNFGKLTSAFGNTGAGCDICAANLIRLFCYYSCSPNQSDFMAYSGEKVVVVTDDNNQLINLTVAVVNVTVNADMACGVYQSCGKVSFMTEISIASALGFISFLFDRGTSESYTKDYVSISNTAGMIFMNGTEVSPPHMCNETNFPNGTDAFGYAVPGTCPCNYCSNSCSPLTMITYGNIGDGFAASHVILAYMFAILLTIGCAFVKGYRKKKANRVTQERLLASQNSEPYSYGNR